MAISLYTGSPGSGKSLHCTSNIIKSLEKGVNVISNYSIDISKINCHQKAIYRHLTDSEITVEYLIEFALKNHVKGKEGQTMLVLDEAQLKFNSRSWQEKNRILWTKFFTVHRHLGYEVIMATQKDTFLDSQIRGLVEYEFIHKNLKKSKLGDIIPFMPNIFICIKVWYHSKMKIAASYFLMSKKVTSCYDSYIMFDKVMDELLKIEGGKNAKSIPAPKILS